MALPVVRQKNAAQIRMTVKDHTEQIVSLSLVPIRRPPNSRDCLDMNIVLGKHHLETNSMMLCGREEMIVDFKPRLFFRAAIKAAKVRQKVEFQTRSGL